MGIIKYDALGRAIHKFILIIMIMSGGVRFIMTAKFLKC